MSLRRTSSSFIAVTAWLIVLLGASSGLYQKDPVLVVYLWFWMLISVLMFEPLQHCWKVLTGGPEPEPPALTGVGLYMGMMAKLEPGTDAYKTAAQGMYYQLKGVHQDQLAQLVKDGPVALNGLISEAAADQLIAWGLAKIAGEGHTVATSYGVDVIQGARA